MQKMIPGKVTKSTRNQYQVFNGNKSYNCVVRGKIVGAKNREITPVKVGDNVLFERISQDEGIILKILPRTSKLSRTVDGKAYQEHIIATNIDQMIIITSSRIPDFKSGLLDRYLVIAEKNHLISVICMNKIDLEDPGKFDKYKEVYKRLGYEFFYTSAVTGQGIDHLFDILKNKVSVVVGQSGVGKSSLIQKIEPDLDLRISEISDKTKKGRHTTSYVELFPLAFGGYIIDTPGIRELGIWDIYQPDLRHYFIEFSEIQSECQFNDCQHLNEPGCAVKKAVEDGRIFGERYKNYKNILLNLRNAPYELIKRR